MQPDTHILEPESPVEKKPRLGGCGSEPIALPTQEFRIETATNCDVTKLEEEDQLKLKKAQSWHIAF